MPNNSYCLLTDSHLHLNAWFGGYYGQYEANPHKALTWMRKIAVLWGHHTMLFEAREGAASEYGSSGYMAGIVVDGERVILSQAGDSATFAAGAIVVKWESAKERSGDDEIDVYSLRIRDVLSLKMELRPEVAALRTPTDGTVHFDLYFPEARLSHSVHGVLGQTFRPDHAHRLSVPLSPFSGLCLIFSVLSLCQLAAEAGVQHSAQHRGGPGGQCSRVPGRSCGGLREQRHAAG